MATSSASFVATLQKVGALYMKSNVPFRLYLGRY